jgi:uncharacterized protein (TIGR03435 family)
MRVAFPSAAAVLLLCMFAAGQARFEVASIKPHPGVIVMSEDPFPRGNRVTAVASTAVDLIQAAYQVHGYQLAGAPAWASSEHFDLEATAASSTPITTDQMRTMLRALLADRFRLQVRRAVRPTKVLALEVAKSGPKLERPSANSGGWAIFSGPDGLTLRAGSMAMPQLAAQLSLTAPRPVMDETGLAGLWTFTLRWWPTNRNPPPDTAVPDMYAGLREIGLQLKSARAPIPMLVVEQISRPTPN